MLCCVWSPKGGSGLSVFSAALALVLARGHGARLVDVGGDQPAVLGIAVDPDTGVRDWLRVGVEAPPDALDRLEVDAGRGLKLIPAGSGALGSVPAEAGAALGVALRSGAPTVVDVGVPADRALHGLLDVADVTIVVLRGCYLALRRATRLCTTFPPTGVVLLDEPGRALGAREVSDVLGLPVLATVPVRSSIARVVDAGVLAARLPDALARPANAVLASIESGREVA